ncbi:hypothetical protein AB1303_01360 [Saccharolobus solfataricus]|uniref:Uncharacterized protein n=2 Tax=Saccharolobus solfataricus TaxID=2287 RepID=Q97YK0_SACS2|nr:hypothetical protein [Saccharolobus solfataricus]AAK41559.1 Hypothetical protein SSO1321 [Saccharolobus solfataricus P2]QPG48574.1 hypothetical protein HFC64_02710 [Saccharolobus solfataricus]SAI84989.1 uncharacterised protein [Saccharolobus solfataricus]
MRLLLTIDTFRQFLPFQNEKIIVIGVMEIDHINKRKDFRFFTEWDLGNEKEMITKFYEYLKGKISEVGSNNLNFFSGKSKILERLFVVGFNILRFDIPILTQKGIEYSIGTVSELNLLWSSLVVIDYLQAMLPYNKMKIKGMSWERFSYILRTTGYKVPRIPSRGSQVKELYIKKDYESILKRNKAKLLTLYSASKIFEKEKI